VGVRVEVDLLVVRVAGPTERLLAGAGPGDGAAEQPDDRRPLGAAVPRVAPRDDVGSDAPLPVGRPGERDERRSAGDVVRDLDGIADGEDVRVARVHLLVDEDATPLADRQTSALREADLGAYADPEDDDVRPECRLGPREDVERPVLRLPDLRDVVAEHEANAVALHVLLDVARHLGVDGGHHLGTTLDERHLQAEMDQVPSRPRPASS